MAEIQSAAQLGHRLRVLVSKHISDPICWVMHQCQLHHRPLQQQDIRLVTANLEDVFVSHTGQNPNLHKQEG